MKFKKISKCVCGKKFKKENKIFFKKFPRTEIIKKNKSSLKNYSFDQEIAQCQNCNHLALTRQIDPKYIYNDNDYIFSSSNSYSAIFANEIFFKFINGYLNKRKKIRSILEIGSNDLYLLKKFYKIANKLTGIDPVIKKDKKYSKIKTIKKFFNNQSLEKIDDDNELIICGHTLEHVEKPEVFIKNVLTKANKNTKIFFQFPSSESLINSGSYDQIHHQHYNYFSINSINEMIKRCGGKLIDFSYNNLHYGALMIFFSKKDSKIKSLKTVKKNNKFININTSYECFSNHLLSCKKIIFNALKNNKKFYVVGAGLMLPLVNYHLGGLLNIANGILDDDKRKIGKYFPGINVKITSLKNTNLKDSICLVGPIASSITTRKLINILGEKQPDQIISPTISF